MFGKSWVQFLSGTQNFSLSHARVMLINSPSQDLSFLNLYSAPKTCMCFLHGRVCNDRLNSCNTLKLQTSEKKGSYSLHGQQGDKVHGNERAGFLQKRSEG